MSEAGGTGGNAGDASDDEVGSAADERMAALLRDSSSGVELRRRLQEDPGADSDDLLSRLNALEFVQQVVGGDVELPEQVGGYRIKGLLGRGGMGTVYLGWQQDLEREVALKVLAPGYAADPTMRKRFRAEARATAALHHRSIVPIYDYGESQGMLFFAMERVDGMSLDKHIAAARRVSRAPLEPLDAARRFAGVADALGFAHRRRLLHRDVKPGNILVAGDGSLALTDFGLAKALDHASMHLTSKGGGFLGTLHYASPEQALGRELTAASDLYSLGVTMFEALTGRLPLAGKTTEALLQSILHGTPMRLRDCVQRPPRDLEAVLDKLLSREPADRYQDGEALARDLQRIADGEPVHIRRLPLYVRVLRRARRNPVLTGAFAVVFLLVLVTAALSFVLRKEKVEGRVSRHQNDMVRIVRDIGSERGSPSGPPPLLEVLTGVTASPVDPAAGILARLDQAGRDAPDDALVGRMRRAYLEAPAPDAMALLRVGRGFEAVQLLDLAILDARARQQLDSEIELYGLYLARAVARLTATVANPEDARTDLALASYLRPGAVFPLALLDMLEVVQRRDAVLSIDRLLQRLRDGEAARRQVTGLLLWSAARERPHEQSNLMDFELGYRRRRALHAAAAMLLTSPPAPCVSRDHATGLARHFVTAGRAALERLGEPDQLRERIADIAGGVAASVHPDSPLFAWRDLLQLLERPRQRGPLVDADEQVLSPMRQLGAFRALVWLAPRPELLRLWLPRFVEFQREHPGISGLVEVAARLHAMSGTAEAVAWADRWVAEAEGDPRAQLTRMRVALRERRFAAAGDDAIVAVQNAIDRDAVLGEVQRALAQAARDADPAAAETLTTMARDFGAVPAVSGAAAGGGR